MDCRSSQTESIVSNIVTEICGRTCDPDENLYETEALDSLKLMELILHLESEFAVSLISEELDFDEFCSINFITKKIQAALSMKMVPT
jgi:acyl carrier protein